MRRCKMKTKTLSDVKTVQDFIEHLQTTYEVTAQIPVTAKVMLATYLPMLNLPKKKNNGY